MKSSRSEHSRQYSCEEVCERMTNGMCLFCEELDTPGHHQLKHQRSKIFMTECEDDQVSGAKDLVSVDLNPIISLPPAKPPDPPDLNPSELISRIKDSIPLENDSVNLGFDIEEEPIVYEKQLLKADDGLDTHVLHNFSTEVAAEIGDDVDVSLENNSELSDCNELFPNSYSLLQVYVSLNREEDSLIQEIESSGVNNLITADMIPEEESSTNKETKPEGFYLVEAFPNHQQLVDIEAPFLEAAPIQYQEGEDFVNNAIAETIQDEDSSLEKKSRQGELYVYLDSVVFSEIYPVLQVPVILVQNGDQVNTVLKDYFSLPKEYQEYSSTLFKSSGGSLRYSHSHCSALSLSEIILPISGSDCTEDKRSNCHYLAKRVWEPGGKLIEHDEDDLDGLQVYVVRNRKLEAELEIYLCSSDSTLAGGFKVASTMRHNIRSYGVWHHRKRVLEEGNQPELRFLNKFQGLYFRNSHAWSCYKFIIELKLEVGVTAKLLVIFGVDWQRLIEWFGVHFHVNKSKDTVDFSRMSNDKKNGTVRDAESKRLRDIEAGYTSARNFHKTRTLYLGKVSEAKNSDKSFGAKELLQKFCWTVLVVILKMFSPLLTATSVNCVVLMDKLPSNSRVDDRQLITGKSINFYEILSQENLKAEVLEKILYNSRDFKFVLTSLLMTILLHIQLTLLVMGIRMTTDLATLIIQTQVQGEGYISSRRSPVYRFLLIGLYDSTLQNNITWKEKNLRMGKEPDFLVDTKMTTRQNKAVTKILKKGRNSFFGDDTVILAFTKETRVAGEFFLLNSGIFKNPRLLYGKENSLLVGFKVARELLVVYKQATMQPYVKHQWKSKKLHTDSGLGTKHPYNFAEFSTCQYVLRGCALIGDENYSTYSWLLQMRLNAASDQAHGVMIPVMISYKMPFQVKQRQQINKSCKSRMFKYKDMRQERYTLETQQHTLKIKLEQGRDYKEVQESAAVSETSEVCSSLLFLKRVATIAYLVFNLLRPPELRRAKWYGQTIYQVFSLSSLRTRMFSTREYCGRISSLVRFNGFKSRFSNFICVIRFDGSVYQTLLVTLFPIF